MNLHPLHQCDDGIINTKSGIQIDLRNPTPERIHIQDIMYGLSNIVRFGGQMEHAYTVAQHSCLVCFLAPEDLKFEALMHDAAEAYIGDVIKPLKIMLGEAYSEIERRFEAAIFSKFNINPERVKLVKPYDMRASEIESGLRYNTKEYPVQSYIEIFGNTVWNHRKAFKNFQLSYMIYSDLHRNGLVTIHSQ